MHYFLAVSYRYKAWIVAKVEALEAGMTVKEEAGTTVKKQAEAKEASASASVKKQAKPSHKRPAHPASEPTDSQRAKAAKQTASETDAWIQTKIAEAADEGKDDQWTSEAWTSEDQLAWTSEACTSEDQLALEPSWRVAMQRYKVDGEAQLQLALLREVDWHAAAEVVWKLTKRGAWDNDLKNPSGFVNRCCTTKLKQLHEQW